MRFENIKTKKQFYEFGDVWYQRTHRLRKFWQDSSKESNKRLKALFLHKIMANRVLRLSKIAIKLNQIKPK